jgi:hypothetical protein
MKAFGALILGLFLQAYGLAQSAEFEGDVHYLHMFSFKKKLPDSSGVLRYFGSSSTYSYRSADYKWSFYDCMMESEYSHAAEGHVYNKYVGRDTFYFTRQSTGNRLISFDITKNADTILGYPCDMIRVVIATSDDPRDILIRNIFYSNDLPLDPKAYKHIDAFCHNEVFPLIRSIPLRIDMMTPAWPFDIRFEAVKVEKRKVAMAEMILPAGAPVLETYER